MDVRLVCADCGKKWFVPGTRPFSVDPMECGACGGALLPLHASVDEPQPSWGAPND